MGGGSSLRSDVSTCGAGNLHLNLSRIHSSNTGARAKSEIQFSGRAPLSQELSSQLTSYGTHDSRSWMTDHFLEKVGSGRTAHTEAVFLCPTWRHLKTPSVQGTPDLHHSTPWLQQVGGFNSSKKYLPSFSKTLRKP